jgi:hypothetical protein
MQEKQKELKELKAGVAEPKNGGWWGQSSPSKAPSPDLRCF